MNGPQMKALAEDMIAAVKAYVARSFTENLSPLEARLLKLETQVAALKKRSGAGK